MSVASPQAAHEAITAARRRAAEAHVAKTLVVIPCLDEAEHLPGILDRLLVEAQQLDMMIVVVDGGSVDGSRDIIRRLQARVPRIALLDNPQRIQSAGVNLAVKRYGEGADFLIRMDAHADYPDQFCETLLTVQATTGADSVVTSTRAAGGTCFQRAVAAAQNSRLGNAGAAHRMPARDRWVDHGHHALMTMSAFRAVGGYDQTFSHNEDAELDMRLRAQGFRIFLSSEVPITYYPRRSPAALYRQFRMYGRGRARNLLKHRARPRLRQLLPLTVVPAIGLLPLAPIAPALALPALCWTVACLTHGLLIGLRRDRCSCAAGLAAMIMHFAWSMGFLGAVASQAWTLGRSRSDPAGTWRKRPVR
jgi:succinoglycan biosynthesis protein ExoA